MKKLLLGILAVATVFSLDACGSKEIDQPEATPNVETNAQVEETASNEEGALFEGEEVGEENTEATEATVEESGEQVGVGNTDEGMVALVLEQHFKNAYPDAIEEVVPNSIKVYTQEEIDANEAIKEHDIKEGDIVFEANYDLKIKEGAEDLNQFTAATGEIDGQWVRNKSNLGIARTGENGYTLDAFGTGW